MKIKELTKRSRPPEPWAEAAGLPWDEPDFSERMLAMHLSQEHDWASRRSDIIDRHVAWLQETVLGSRPSRILDLGCGPGLYLQRLAALGHDCEGIDFSPASIAHAVKAAAEAKLKIRYRREDLRGAELGEGFDLVMMIWGEFNVFSPGQAIDLLRRASAALAPEGRLLLEVSRFEAVRKLGCTAPHWITADSGLFSSRPHLRLEESFWDEERRAATQCFHIVDLASSRLSSHQISSQAYEDDDLRRLLATAGFSDVSRHASLTGLADADTTEVVVYLGERRTGS
jgi:SAM-dependent methyltransferase